MAKRDDSVLPTDDFERQIARLTGLPNGAHTQPAVVQDTDFYGKTTSWMVQTFKHDGGETAFLTQVNSEDGTASARRFVLPPRVLAVIDRQRQSTQTMVRRRHGKRLAEERKSRGEQPAFLKAKRD